MIRLWLELLKGSQSAGQVTVVCGEKKVRQVYGQDKAEKVAETAPVSLSKEHIGPSSTCGTWHYEAGTYQAGRSTECIRGRAAKIFKIWRTWAGESWKDPVRESRDPTGSWSANRVITNEHWTLQKLPSADGGELWQQHKQLPHRRKLSSWWKEEQDAGTEWPAAAANWFIG